MDFTYESYTGLIGKLREQDYQFSDYHNYKNKDKVCILRHDIDNCVDAAVRMAELESALGVASTWFVLVTSNFYNPFSMENREKLRKIASGGALPRAAF